MSYGLSRAGSWRTRTREALDQQTATEISIRLRQMGARIEECVELLQQLQTLISGRDFSCQSELREFEEGISRLRSRLTERLNGHRLETEVLTPCLDVA